jgi:hypothetical protein
LTSLWAGRSANLSLCQDAATLLLRTLVSEVSPIAAAVGAWAAERQTADR